MVEKTGMLINTLHQATGWVLWGNEQLHKLQANQTRPTAAALCHLLIMCMKQIVLLKAMTHISTASLH